MLVPPAVLRRERNTSSQFACSWRHNRLIDRVLDVLTKTAAGPALDEVDRDDLLGRLDPEADSRPATTHAPFETRRFAQPDPEPPACSGRSPCPAPDGRTDRSPGRRCDCSSSTACAETEEAPAVQLTFVEHHLRKLQIVLSRAHQTTCAREVDARDCIGLVARRNPRGVV